MVGWAVTCISQYTSVIHFIAFQGEISLKAPPIVKFTRVIPENDIKAVQPLSILATQ